jgi:uncharacterized protein
MHAAAGVLFVMWWRVFATWFVVVVALVAVYRVVRRAWPAAAVRVGLALLVLTGTFAAAEIVLAPFGLRPKVFAFAPQVGTWLVLWSSVVFSSCMFLLLSFPVWGSVALWLSRPGPPPDPRRRRLLAAAGVLPASVASLGPVGAALSTRPVRVTTRTVAHPTVPAAWDGLRILQISDLHVGSFISLPDVAALVAEAKTTAPDVVVVTGDVCDRPASLRAAIDMIMTLRPPFGVFFTIGNHEIYRGLAHYKASVVDAGGVLLVDEHVILQRGGAPLVLAGIDDPGTLRTASAWFTDRVHRAFSGAQAPCKILLSHRPDALDAAAELDVALVLSGHTHGAQLGLWSRSILEWVLPHRRLWGLYTSSGAGHWFPFRMGCPREITVITLMAESTAASHPV